MKELPAYQWIKTHVQETYVGWNISVLITFVLIPFSLTIIVASSACLSCTTFLCVIKSPGLPYLCWGCHKLDYSWYYRSLFSFTPFFSVRNIVQYRTSLFIALQTFPVSCHLISLAFFFKALLSFSIPGNVIQCPAILSSNLQSCYLPYNSVSCNNSVDCRSPALFTSRWTKVYFTLLCIKTLSHLGMILRYAISRYGSAIITCSLSVVECWS